jgi:uncharacterized protein (DUF1697 family)
MTPCIALLRGINVGRAKRIAMEDLRDLVSGLGHTSVRTVLNSGNVLFETTRPDTRKLEQSLQAGIKSTFGFSANVVVITAADLTAVIRENPLRRIVSDASRFLVAFASDPDMLQKVRPLLREPWEPDRLAIGAKAAYIWCANGVIKSKLLQAVTRLTGEALTTRNWATVLKLQAALGSPPQP